MSKIIKVKKSDLEVIDGYLCLKGVPVSVQNQQRILAQFEYFELKVQKAEYIEAQPDQAPAPSLRGWEPVPKRRVELDLDPEDQALLDAIEAEEKMKAHVVSKLILKEKCQALANDFVDLFEFAGSDEIFVHYGANIEHGWSQVYLDCTEDTLCSALEFIVKQYDRLEPTGKGCFQSCGCVEL